MFHISRIRFKTSLQRTSVSPLLPKKNLLMEIHDKGVGVGHVEDWRARTSFNVARKLYRGSLTRSGRLSAPLMCLCPLARDFSGEFRGIARIPPRSVRYTWKNYNSSLKNFKLLSYANYFWIVRGIIHQLVKYFDQKFIKYARILLPRSSSRISPSNAVKMRAIEIT